MKTPLIQTKAFEDKGLLHTFIKDESANAHGTIKDRRNEVIVKEANRLKVDKLVLITSGNNGYSLAQLAKNTPIKVVCVVDRAMNNNIIASLRDVAYHVIELNLTEKILRPEEIIAFARERDDEVIWDVTNGYESSYASIVRELFEELDHIDYIVTPLGSGGIFTGLVQTLEQSGKQTKVVGIGTQSPYNSVADKLSTPWTPYTRAIENYTQGEHTVIRLDEDEIRSTFQKYQHVAKMEPSAAVVFAAPGKYSFKEDEVIVFVNSGKSHIETL